jgi:hypothetical protein
MGWIIAIVIIVILLIAILSSRRKNRKSASLQGARKFDVTLRDNIPNIAHKKDIIIVKLESSETSEIYKVLDKGYFNRLRITIKYETGNPKPGEAVIKERAIDIYSLGKDYFDAYCHFRHEIRTFKKSRVLWARLSQATYSIPSSYVSSDWVVKGWGDLKD